MSTRGGFILETANLEKQRKKQGKQCKPKMHRQNKEQPRKQKKSKQKVQPKKHKQREEQPRKKKNTHLKHSLTLSNQKVNRGNATTRTTSP